MIRNLSLTLRELAVSTVKAVAALQQSFDEFVKIFWTMVKLLITYFADQEVVCALAKTIYCTYINSPGEVETQLYKVREQAYWLEQITPDSPWSSELFSWLPSGLKLWFGTIM